MKKVSIIVPIFNSSKYLRRCLNSIIFQTYSNLEIILVNDGSEDESLSICKEYKKKDSRIIVIDQVNKGVSIARNNALEITSGDYISFIDSDDYIDLDMYASLLYYAEEYHADIVECGYYSIQGDEKVNKFTLEFEVLTSNKVITEKFVSRINTANSNWNKLFKTHLFKEIRFPAYKYSEDYYINMLICLKAKTKVSIKEAYYYYFLNDDGAMNKPFSVNKLDNINARMEILEISNTRNLSDHIQQLIRLDIISNIIIMYIELLSSDYKDKEMIVSFLRGNFFEHISQVTTKYIFKYRAGMLAFLIEIYRFSPSLFELIVKIIYS